MSEQIGTLKQYQAWLMSQRDELLAALTEYIAASDNSMNPPEDDDVSAILRFGEADKAARAAITNATTTKGSK